MWVHCPEEFEIVEATSPANNDVFPMVANEPKFPYGIRLVDQLQNTIVVTCGRKLEEAP
jgi:hypothetical protein